MDCHCPLWLSSASFSATLSLLPHDLAYPSFLSSPSSSSTSSSSCLSSCSSWALYFGAFLPTLLLFRRHHSSVVFLLPLHLRMMKLLFVTLSSIAPSVSSFFSFFYFLLSLLLLLHPLLLSFIMPHNHRIIIFPGAQGARMLGKEGSLVIILFGTSRISFSQNSCYRIIFCC